VSRILCGAAEVPKASLEDVRDPRVAWPRYSRKFTINFGMPIFMLPGVLDSRLGNRFVAKLSSLEVSGRASLVLQGVG